MSISAVALRESYEAADPALREATDEAFRAVTASIKSNPRYIVLNDDAVENLVDQIYLFICESNGIKL